MAYVYCLGSKKNPKFHYYGYSDNLKDRLSRHERGSVKTTRRFLPIYLLGYKEFDSSSEAKVFEKLLKTNYQIRKQFLIDIKINTAG